MFELPLRRRVMTIGRHCDDSGDILCSAAASLFDPLGGISKDCEVADPVRIGASSLDVALSIRRVIRANFTSWVGILEGNGGRQKRQSSIAY